MQKEGNGEQLLLFMHRMNLPRGSRGNCHVVATMFNRLNQRVSPESPEKRVPLDLNGWPSSMPDPNAVAASIGCGQSGCRLSGAYIPF